MFLRGLGIAAPETCYSQADCWSALQNSSELNRLTTRSQALLQKILLGNSGIQTRHLALPGLAQAFDLHPDVLNARFEKHAPELAALAAERACHESGLSWEKIDGLIISTCTGYLCPGLTSHIVERLALRSGVFALDLVGQGCVAAMPNLRTAEALLASRRCQIVLSICVEVCSAAFYLDNDPGVLISACLFGDGAAAAILSAEPGPGRRISWKTFASTLTPSHREMLRFEQRNGMLRNVLSPQVPSFAGEAAGALLWKMLVADGISRGQINGWILHAGGREVLLELQKHLELTSHDLAWSAQILREYGNVSSPAVLFALDAALKQNAPGGLWWMSSFGAGFSCHGAFLEVE